jgi:hypothetical protein
VISLDVLIAQCSCDLDTGSQATLNRTVTEVTPDASKCQNCEPNLTIKGVRDARTLSKLHPRFIGAVSVGAILGGMSVRFSTAAAAACLSLWAVAGAFAAAPPPRGANVPVAAAPAASSSTASTTAAGAPAAPSGEAAAKHAKRTACLKDAKTRKLVGAEKTSFLKACIAAPP